MVGSKKLWCLAFAVALPLSLVAAPPPAAEDAAAKAAPAEPLPIDLPTVLRLVNASNPTVALARERIQEAYAHQREAEFAWLPDLQSGPAYVRHDGEIQNATGIVFGTNKSNFFTGGGAVLSWDAGNLYFAPLIARRLTAAQTAAAQAVTNDVQLDAALTYLELVRIHAALAINADTLARAEEMLGYARAGEKAQMGKSPADITRAQTEVSLRRVERIDLKGQAAVVSARLAQLLLLQPTVKLQPQEPPVVPVALVPMDTGIDELVDMGLQTRPELREGQFLEEAAQARLRQARVAPFLPRLQVGYAAGVFGGGINSDMSNFNGRGDGTAQAVWEWHNLGAGDVARVRARRSQVNQADYYLAEVRARIGAEVAAAASQVLARQEALDGSQDAIRQALETWQRLQKALFGMAGKNREYDPLEPLLAEQALDQARQRYLNEVIEYNKSQFRLYWAMGQPLLCGLPSAKTLPVEVPVAPAPYQTPAVMPLPAPRPLDPKK